MSQTSSEQRQSPPAWLWRERTTCRLCGKPELQQRIEFPPMAIASTNFHYDRLGIDEASYTAPMPMPLDVCQSCGLIQIRIVSNPEVLYREYSYKTNFSLGLPQHFVDAAQVLVDRLDLKSGQRVVEFGSNDGTYLRAFQKYGLEVLGIDPAVEIAETATRNGIETYSEFFNQALAEKIHEKYGSANLLVANNVIANVDDLADVFQASALLLADDGAFVFETQYGRDIFDKFLLDTVYHEHLTYFNVTPLTRTLGEMGLEVFDVEQIPTKGGSIRVFVQRKGAPQPVAPAVAELVAAEARDGVESEPYFNSFAEELAVRRAEIVKIVQQVRATSVKIAGYGASIGTATLLGQLGLIGEIDFLVDDDPDKPEHFVGPGFSIPLKRPAALVEEGVELAVIFAWRYTDSILAQNAEYRSRGGKFLVPLPKPRVV